MEITNTEKARVIPVTAGDIMHLIGGFGLRIPYQAHGPLSSDIAHFPEPVEDVTASNYDDIFRCSGE